LDWSRKAVYLEVFRYYQGLIALRRAHPAFRMVSAAQIQKHLQFLDLPPEGIGYLLTGHANQDPWETIAVLFNAGQKKLEVALPGEEWVAVVDGKQAGTKELWRICRSSTLVPPRSAQILVDAKSYDRSLKGE
jgi:pullulanase